jgi:hypothetical protein
VRLISATNRIYKACGLNDLEQIENCPEYDPKVVLTAELIEQYLQGPEQGPGLSSVSRRRRRPRPRVEGLWLSPVGHGLTHWYPATVYLLLPLIGAELGPVVQPDRPDHDLPVHRLGGGERARRSPRRHCRPQGPADGDLALLGRAFPYLLISFTHSFSMLLGLHRAGRLRQQPVAPDRDPDPRAALSGAKGLVLSLHGMGGNVGDAIAPLVVGAALAFFSWRQVVVLNVAPGLLVAALMLVFLGSIRLGAKRASAEKQSLRDYSRGLRELLRNRSVVLLSTGSAFRTMTQTALLTFLPVYLAHDMGYSAAWVGACLFVLQAAGFAAAPVAGHLSDRMGRKHILVGSMLSSGAVLALMAFAGGSPVFIALVAVPRLLPLCHAAGDPGLAAREHAEEHGRLEHRRDCSARRRSAARSARCSAGMVADHYGLLATFYLLAAMIVVANLFVFWVPGAPEASANVKN